MDIPLSAWVECSDGVCGQSTALIVDPETKGLTHFVVEAKEIEAPHQRLVPIELVVETTHDRIRLSCTKEKIGFLDPFIATRTVTSQQRDSSYYLGEGQMSGATPRYTTVHTTIDEELVPKGERVIHKGAEVHATDGRVGTVDQLVMDQSTNTVSHFTLLKGHLWGKKDVLLPLTVIDRTEGDIVYLSLDKEAIAQLPSVPLERTQAQTQESTEMAESLLASSVALEKESDSAPPESAAEEKGAAKRRGWPQDKGPKKVTAIGFGHRLAAFLLDAVIMAFFGMTLAVFVAIVGYLVQVFTPNNPIPMEWLIVGTGILFSIAYYLVSWTKSGQTIGKTFLGIKIVDAEGNPPSGGKALLRYVGYLISGLVLSLGFMWVLFDRKRQGWHDKIAGTFVVFIDDNFDDIKAVDLVSEDQKRGWLWILLWVVVALALPVGLLVTVLAVGPYIGSLLVQWLGGGS